MPATPEDARDLLIASVLCDDPVLYIDDRWLYGEEQEVGPVRETVLSRVGPAVRREGAHVTLVGCGYTSLQCLRAATALEASGVLAEVVDLRILNPLDHGPVAASVAKTGRLCVVDGGWRNCGIAGEVIAGTVERLPLGALRATPRRLTLVDAPAPTSRVLEDAYYPQDREIVQTVLEMVHPSS
jgi:pyruvate dehydrogenase E1 component beta subunit